LERKARSRQVADKGKHTVTCIRLSNVWL
jgi:hypothetical protein